MQPRRLRAGTSPRWTRPLDTPSAQSTPCANDRQPRRGGHGDERTAAFFCNIFAAGEGGEGARGATRSEAGTPNMRHTSQNAGKCRLGARRLKYSKYSKYSETRSSYDNESDGSSTDHRRRLRCRRLLRRPPTATAHARSRDRPRSQYPPYQDLVVLVGFVVVVVPPPALLLLLLRSLACYCA